MSSPFLLSLAPLRSPDRQISLFRAQSLLPCGLRPPLDDSIPGLWSTRGRGIRSAHHLQNCTSKSNSPGPRRPKSRSIGDRPLDPSMPVPPDPHPRQVPARERSICAGPPAGATCTHCPPARLGSPPRPAPPRPARTGHAQSRVTRRPAGVRSEPCRVRPSPGGLTRSHGAHRGGGCGPLRILTLPAAAHAALPPGEAAPWAPSARPSRGPEPRPQP